MLKIIMTLFKGYEELYCLHIKASFSWSTCNVALSTSDSQPLKTTLLSGRKEAIILGTVWNITH